MPISRRRMIRGADGAFELTDDLLCATHATRNVIADVEHASGARGRPEQGIERCDSPCVGRWNGKSLAHVIECAFTDPTDPRLHRVQRREEEMPSLACRMATVRGMGVRCRIPLTTLPLRPGRPEQSVHGFALRHRWCGIAQVQIHPSDSDHRRASRAPRRRSIIGVREPEPARARTRAGVGRATGSTLTAQALNSAVPDSLVRLRRSSIRLREPVLIVRAS